MHFVFLKLAMSAALVCSTSALSFQERRLQYVSSKSQRDGEDGRDPEWQTACMGTNKLVVQQGNVEYSNIGGLGPDTQRPEGMLIKDVFPYSYEKIDLKITAVGPYKAFNASMNGEQGDYLNINVMSGEGVELNFDFQDQNGAATQSPSAWSMTILDFDMESADGEGAESVSLAGQTEHIVTRDTTIHVSKNNDTGREVFTASIVGDVHDNPYHTWQLNEEQKKKAIIFLFPRNSGFSTRFFSTAGSQGRNFMLSGSSALACEEGQECAQYTCPPGYINLGLKPEETWGRGKTEGLFCRHMPCNGPEEVDACCVKISDMGNNNGNNNNNGPNQGSLASSPCQMEKILEFHDIHTREYVIPEPDQTWDSDHTGGAFLEYGDILPPLEDGSSIDLQLVNVGGYRPEHKFESGLNGEFGTLNFEAGYEASINFRFINRETGLLHIPDPFYFTVFELHEDRHGRNRETIQVYPGEPGEVPPLNSAYLDYYCTENTTVKTTDGFNFISSTPGWMGTEYEGAPLHPLALTGLEASSAVSFRMPAVHTFALKFLVADDGDLTGRNILFAGASSLVCDSRASCLTYECPDDYKPKPQRERRVCSGDPCWTGSGLGQWRPEWAKDADRDRCCMPNSGPKKDVATGAGHGGHGENEHADLDPH